MIKKLEIKNFQSHEHTEINFSPGVNVIYGLSQAGKTAILRALRLAIYNRPSGAKYYSNFAESKGKTEINVQLDNGNIKLTKSVKRSKDGQKILEGTQYEANGMTFSPGIDVPEEIRKLFNMTEINIQNQFDAPFLATSSPGEIARTINRIVKLEEVDKWKSDLTKKINRTNQEVEILVNQIKQIEIELAKYKGFEDLQEQVSALIKINNEYRFELARLKDLDALLIKIESIEVDRNRISKILDILQELEAIEMENIAVYNQIMKIKGMKVLQDEINEYIAVTNDLTRLIEIEEQINYFASLKKKLEQLKNLAGEIQNLRQLIPELIRLTEIEDILKQKNVLLTKMTIIKDINDIMNKKKEEIMEYISKYTAILDRDKRCPICMTTIDSKIIKRIQKELINE